MGFVARCSFWEGRVSLFLVAAMMLVQAPAAEPQPAPPAQAAKKVKKPQVCEYLEITGSRAKQRVCHDAEGNLEPIPGVSNSAYGKTRVNEPNVQTGGPGDPGGSH
jgi:hypothetical protein